VAARWSRATAMAEFRFAEVRSEERISICDTMIDGIEPR
jgi:hypothetical protein